MNKILIYQKDLENFVRSKIKTDDWQDVVQETLYYLCIKIDNINVTNYKGLLFNTANFFILKHFNKKDKKVNIQTHTKPNIQPILKSFKHIKEIHLKPFLMAVYGYKTKDIAVILKTNENTIKTRIRTCRNKLKDLNKDMI